MDRRGKTLVAGIDAVLMGVVAFGRAGVPLAPHASDIVLWGAVVSAALCAVVISVSGAALVAWAAIGYVLFGGLLTRGAPHVLLLALALALMPLVPRPRGSLLAGLVAAAVSAVAFRALVVILL